MKIKSPDFKQTVMRVFGTERNVFSVDVESIDVFCKQHYVVIACVEMKDKLNFGLAITHPKDKVDKPFGLRLAAERAIRKPYFSMKIKKINWVDSTSIIKSTLGIERKRINSLINGFLTESISYGTEIDADDASVSKLSEAYNDTFTPDEWSDLLNAITMGCNYRNESHHATQSKPNSTDNMSASDLKKDTPKGKEVPKTKKRILNGKEIPTEKESNVDTIYIVTDNDIIDFFLKLGYFPL